MKLVKLQVNYNGTYVLKIITMFYMLLPKLIKIRPCNLCAFVQS